MYASSILDSADREFARRILLKESHIVGCLWLDARGCSVMGLVFSKEGLVEAACRAYDEIKEAV